jgi:hypothetical protein
MLIAICFGAIAALLVATTQFWRTKGSDVGIDRVRFPKKGIRAIGELHSILLIMQSAEPQDVELTVFRQSGNLERTEVYSSVESALKAAMIIFARMKEPTVRIWANECLFVDIRRPHHSARGSNEGKKIWGVSLRIVG